MEIAGADRPVLDVGRVLVARAVDRPAPDAPAGQELRVAVGPVVSAGHGVDPGRAAEIARHGHEGLVEQPPAFQVLQQGGERPVERRRAVRVLDHVQAGPGPADAADVGHHPVVVPEVELAPLLVEEGPEHVDEPDPRLHEAAGQQEALAVLVAPVAVPQASGPRGSGRTPGGTTRSRASSTDLSKFDAQRSSTGVGTRPARSASDAASRSRRARNRSGPTSRREVERVELQVLGGERVDASARSASRRRRPAPGIRPTAPCGAARGS